MAKAPNMKKISIFLTLCLAAAGVTYIASSRKGAIKDMTLRPLAGVVTLVRDGDEKSVRGDTSLQPGDRIVTTQAGRATLKLEGERQAWLQGQSEVAVVNEHSLESIAGDLRSQVGDETTIEFDGIVATALDSHFRIDQGFGSSRVASYQGEVHLAKPGEPRLRLDSLFEAEAAAADLPADSRPYRFDVADEWDSEILEDVIALDEDLSQLGQGLAAQLGRKRPPLNYFNELAGRRVGFMKSFMHRPTEDLLIGFTVADNSKKSSLEKAFKRAMGYRGEGGRWGVVASILEAKPKDLVADLKSVIVATGAGGDGGRAQPEFTVASAADAVGGPGSSGGTLGGPGDPGGEDDRNNNNGGGKKDPPGDAEDCGDPAECLQKDLEDRLPGEGDPSPSPSEPPKQSGGSGSGGGGGLPKGSNDPVTSGVLDQL